MYNCNVFYAHLKNGKYYVNTCGGQFYNQPSPQGTPELWPLNCPKTEYSAPKNVISIELSKNTAGVFCVSLALLFNIMNIFSFLSCKYILFLKL